MYLKIWHKNTKSVKSTTQWVNIRKMHASTKNNQNKSFLVWVHVCLSAMPFFWWAKLTQIHKTTILSWISIHFHLCERQSDKESLHPLVQSLNAAARARPDLNQEPGTPSKSITWAAATLTLGPPSTASWDALTGSLIINREARTWSGILTCNNVSQALTYSPVPRGPPLLYDFRHYFDRMP